MATAVIYTIGSSAPINHDAANSFENACFCCGRKLGANVYLMHVNTNWEIVARNYEGNDSQGCFPIGSSCKNKFAADAIFKFKK